MCDKCRKQVEPCEYTAGDGIKFFRDAYGVYFSNDSDLKFESFNELREWDLAETYDCR
jgi:hypothetical protein